MKRTYSLWSLLPDWMYMLMSADGQHFRKDVTLLHNFTKTVRPTPGSYMTMNVLCRFNREIDMI